MGRCSGRTSSESPQDLMFDNLPYAHTTALPVNSGYGEDFRSTPLGRLRERAKPYNAKEDRGKRTHLAPYKKEVCMKKAKLQELFKGITESQEKVNRITEQGSFWLVSFENKRLGNMCITATKSADIANEIKRHATFCGGAK